MTQDGSSPARLRPAGLVTLGDLVTSFEVLHRQLVLEEDDTIPVRNHRNGF
jgi:hypothetical protein